MRSFMAAGLLMILVGVPGTAAAQSCFGVPSTGRQYDLEMGLAKAGNLTTYGVGAGADFEGPLFGTLSYTMGSVDGISEKVNDFLAQLGYEVGNSGGVSVCPAVGVGYQSFGIELFGVELDASAVLGGAGFGIGKSIPSGSLTLTPYAIPKFVFARVTAEVADGESSAEETDTRNFFVGTFGATVDFGQIFVGPVIQVSSEEDTDPSFGIRAGVVIR